MLATKRADEADELVESLISQFREMGEIDGRHSEVLDAPALLFLVDSAIDVEVLESAGVKVNDVVVFLFRAYSDGAKEGKR